MSAKISRTKRSPVWAYFEEAGGSVKCNLCNQTLVRTSGTTNLFSHLKTHHQEQHDLVTGKQAPALSGGTTAAGTKSVASFFPSATARTCDSRRAGIITERILDWVVGSLRPLSVVEDNGLIDLVKFLEPEYKMPSRTHIVKLLDKRHSSCKSEMKSLLKSEGAAGVSLTTDGWTSTSTQSFVTHTVHFVNKQWELVNGVLETVVFKGSHTAEKLADCTQEAIGKFNIKHEQVVAITHDEAANMVAASRVLAEENSWESNVCMAHRLQTAIRHALDVEAVTKLLARCRKLVGHFKHSCLAAEALANRQTQLNASQQPLKVIQDVATRWNSSYYMLRRLLELRVSLTAVLCDSSVTPKQADRDMLLKDGQWKLAEQLVNILEPFEAATTAVSGQGYVTLSLLMPVTCHLYAVMQAECAKPLSAPAKSVAMKLQSELVRKFPSIQGSSPLSLPVVCAALDPRFRCLRFLDEDKISAARDHVKSLVIENSTSSSMRSSTVEPPAKKTCGSSGGLSRLFSSWDSSKATAAGSHEDSESRSRDRELEVYFMEDEVDADESPLKWWKENEHRYPCLSQLARKYLSVPATSVPSERVFSAAGRLVTKLRNSLSPTHIDASIFLSSNTMLSGARYNTSTAPKTINLAAAVAEEEEDEAEELPLLALPSLATIDASDDSAGDGDDDDDDDIEDDDEE